MRMLLDYFARRASIVTPTAAARLLPTKLVHMQLVISARPATPMPIGRRMAGDASTKSQGSTSRLFRPMSTGSPMR